MPKKTVSTPRDSNLMFLRIYPQLQIAKIKLETELLKKPKDYKGEKGNGCTPDLPGMDETDLAPEFRDACDIHDWQYGEENTKRGEEHQKEADDLMLENMLEIASNYSWFKRTLLTIKAYVFYGFIRSFGKFFYRKDDKK